MTKLTDLITTSSASSYKVQDKAVLLSNGIQLATMFNQIVVSYNNFTRCYSFPLFRFEKYICTTTISYKYNMIK